MPELRSTALLTALVRTLGPTVRDLADKCRCSKTHVADLLSGKRIKTTEATAVLLAAALRVPYSTLFIAPLATADAGPSERLVPTRWVAERLGCTEEWVRDQAAAGVLPHTRVGQQLRFKPSDIDAFITANGSAAA